MAKIQKTASKGSYKRQYTEAEKKVILKKVANLKGKGMPLSRAIVKAGITYRSYQAWTGTLPKKKSALESFMVPLDVDSPLILMVGKPQEINAALNQLSTILKG